MSGVVIDLDDQSDTGFKNNDNLTNDTSPTFTVSSLVPTDSVYIYFNGADSNKLKADATTESFTGALTTDGSTSLLLNQEILLEIYLQLIRS